MYLTLDLSSKCTGYSFFTSDGKLTEKGRIEPDKKIENFFKIHYIIERIKPLFNRAEDLIIEDIYYGVNVKSLIYLARLSGAVIDAWVGYKFKEPILYTASQARALAGLNGHSHKAEIQVYVLEKYKFATKNKIKEYKEQIEDLKKQYKDKKIKKGSYKYKMNKLSNQIDKDTSIGEDIADSIILGLAYQEAIK